MLRIRGGKEYEATCQNCKIEFAHFLQCLCTCEYKPVGPLAMVVPPSLLWKSNGVKAFFGPKLPGQSEGSEGQRGDFPGQTVDF